MRCDFSTQKKGASMIYTIENDKFSVSVATAGAQLQSMYSKTTKTEYIWQGDPKYWTGRAYNLFPFIGRMYKGIYNYQGEFYTSRAHGVARYNEFRLEERSANRLVMLMTENEETLKEFPFHFEFRVFFELTDNILNVRYEVTNTDTKTLICAFGGHPGINIPFGDGEFEDYYVEFSDKTSVQRQLLSESDRFMAGKSIPFALEDGTKMPLRHDLFNHDAVILSNTSRYVSIKSDKTNRRVGMKFDDFKYLGIWHPGDTDAPFICLEPWGALPATDGIIDNLETKADMTHVPPQKTTEVSYTVEIYE